MRRSGVRASPGAKFLKTGANFRGRDFGYNLATTHITQAIPTFCRYSLGDVLLKFHPPDEGLEPATLRLKVWCSTDWANRAWVIRKICEFNESCFEIDHPILSFSMEILLFTRAYSNDLGLLEPIYCSFKNKKSQGSYSHFCLPSDTSPVSSVGRASDF